MSRRQCCPAACPSWCPWRLEPSYLSCRSLLLSQLTRILLLQRLSPCILRLGDRRRLPKLDLPGRSFRLCPRGLLLLRTSCLWLLSSSLTFVRRLQSRPLVVCLLGCWRRSGSSRIRGLSDPLWTTIWMKNAWLLILYWKKYKMYILTLLMVERNRPVTYIVWDLKKLAIRYLLQRPL